MSACWHCWQHRCLQKHHQIAVVPYLQLPHYLVLVLVAVMMGWQAPVAEDHPDAGNPSMLCIHSSYLLMIQS